MDGLGGADGGQVAIALIGEDHIIGLGTLDAGGDGGSTPMGSLHHITVEVIVCHNGTAYRRNADGVAQHAQLLQTLRHQTVDDAVGAAGAVMGLLIGQTLGFLKHDGHDYRAPPAIFSISARTSAGVGTMPPVRP